MSSLFNSQANVFRSDVARKSLLLCLLDKGAGSSSDSDEELDDDDELLTRFLLRFLRRKRFLSFLSSFLCSSTVFWRSSSLWSSVSLLESDGDDDVDIRRFRFPLTGLCGGSTSGDGHR